jgi:hypothetical protein
MAPGDLSGGGSSQRESFPIGTACPMNPPISSTQTFVPRWSVLARPSATTTCSLPRTHDLAA